MVVNLKIVLEKLLGLADLSGAQIFCIHKAIKVVIICEDKHLVLIVFQIVTSYFESFDNS